MQINRTSLDNLLLVQIIVSGRIPISHRVAPGRHM